MTSGIRTELLSTGNVELNLWRVAVKSAIECGCQISLFSQVLPFTAGVSLSLKVGDPSGPVEGISRWPRLNGISEKTLVINYSD